MKSIVKVRFMRCFVLMALLLYLAPLQAQSIIYDDSQQLGETSIIRNYKENVDITYNAAAGEIDRFNYIDRNTLMVYTAPLTEPIAIHDFVIIGDTVFFCGSCTIVKSSQKPVYGYFDINKVFFSGGAIKYWTANVQSGNSPNYSEITSWDKIDVLKTTYGETHLLMTGYGCKFIGNMFYSDVWAIADALIDNLGLHTIYYHIDTNCVFRYKDVAITDNYAIVAAYSTMGRYDLFYYTHPVNPGYCLFSAYYVPGTTIANVPWRYEIPGTPALPSPFNVIIAKMTQDAFAVLCYRLGVGNDVVTLSIYNSPTMSPIHKCIVSYNNDCREMVYNPLLKTLYITQGWTDILGIKAPFTTTNYISTIFDNYMWLSVDNADLDTHEILSGFDNYTLEKKIWRLDELNQNSCVVYNSTDNEGLDKTEVDTLLFQATDRRFPDENRFRPDIKTLKLNILCGK